MTEEEKKCPIITSAIIIAASIGLAADSSAENSVLAPELIDSGVCLKSKCQLWVWNSCGLGK